MERDQATELIHNLLRGMITKNASDLFISAGFPPAFKIDGKMTPVSNQALSSKHTMELANSIMNDRQIAEFEATHECNFAISPSNIGRFRVNVFIPLAQGLLDMGDGQPQRLLLLRLRLRVRFRH